MSRRFSRCGLCMAVPLIALSALLLLNSGTSTAPAGSERELSTVSVGKWRFPESLDDPNSLKASAIPGRVAVTDGPLRPWTSCFVLEVTGKSPRLKTVCEVAEAHSVWFAPDARRLAAYAGSRKAAWKIYDHDCQVAKTIAAHPGMMGPLSLTQSADSRMLFGHYVDKTPDGKFRPFLFSVELRRRVTRAGPSGAFPVYDPKSSRVYYLKYGEWYPVPENVSLCRARTDWSREQVVRRFETPVFELTIRPEKELFAVVEAPLEASVPRRRNAVVFSLDESIRYNISHRGMICADVQFGGDGLLAYAAWKEDQKRHSLYVAEIGKEVKSDLISDSMRGLTGSHCWTRDGDVLAWIEAEEADGATYTLRAVRFKNGADGGRRRSEKGKR